MYPHRGITKKAIAGLSDKGRQDLEQESRSEVRRIGSLRTEHSLRVELEEAAQKWEHGYEQLQRGHDDELFTLEQARFEMGLANQRYWAALSQLDSVLDRTRLVTRVQFWLIVVGGLLIALVGTIYTVLSYYKCP
jgi:hypothetical protein